MHTGSKVVVRLAVLATPEQDLRDFLYGDIFVPIFASRLDAGGANEEVFVLFQVRRDSVQIVVGGHKARRGEYEVFVARKPLLPNDRRVGRVGNYTIQSELRRIRSMYNYQLTMNNIGLNPPTDRALFIVN